jgi:Family of unknown function (DUF6082)
MNIMGHSQLLTDSTQIGDEPMKRRFSIGRALRVALAIAAGLIAVILVIFSPFAITRLQGLSKDWVELSNIGSTYGGISALISSLALGAVVVSLLYQARAGQTAREQSIRSLQQQLIRMEMEDPALMTAMGAPWGLPIPAESAKIRAHLYIHMWATFWAGNYVVGELTGPAARKLVRSELFNSTAGRKYWATIRENVLSTNEGKYRRFALIVDEEYWKIVAGDAPVAQPVKATGYMGEPEPVRKKEYPQVLLLGMALTIGILTGRKLSRWGTHDNALK